MPNLSIVGDNHAQYLKDKRSESRYTYFLPDTFIERLDYKINSLFRKVQPDTVQPWQLMKRTEANKQEKPE